MADIVDAATRSRMMANIRGRNTKPELFIRSALHRAGFRFRIHVGTLPGRPDLVLKKHSAIIFVHGCFWHGHNCHYFRWPTTRQAFWKEKIEATKVRDQHNLLALQEAGWRVMTIWECGLRDQNEAARQKLVGKLCQWLTGTERKGVLSG